jgi:hypothetical protein
MEKKEVFDEIFDRTIPHSAFLDKRSVLSCMYQAYMVGKEEYQESYNKLESTFEKLLEEFLSSEKNRKIRSQIIEDWRKKAGTI